MTQDYRTFHLQRFARGPATAGDKNRSVTNHEYSNGRKTSYHGIEYLEWLSRVQKEAEADERKR